MGGPGVNEKAQEIISWHVENGRKAKLTNDQLACCIRQALEQDGLLRDLDGVYVSKEAVEPAKRDPLVSEIRWSTDFSKGPTISNNTQVLFMVWLSEFRMACIERSGHEALQTFAARAAATSPLKVGDDTREPLQPKEFAWAEVVAWPPAAHEAIAERLQAEADRFARQAKEARDMAA